MLLVPSSILRWQFRRRARAFLAELQSLWSGESFAGELFVAGGAFKPLLSAQATWNDVDLWVRDRKSREKLDAHLRESGFELENDFHPYCRAYRKAGTAVEITYHNIKSGDAARVYRDFDLSPSRIAARFEHGQPMEILAAEDFWDCLDSRIIRLNPEIMTRIRRDQDAQIILNLHRLRAWADNLGWDVDESLESELWKIFETEYSAESTKAAVELAWKILVRYKESPHSPVWLRVCRDEKARAIIADLENPLS